MDCLEHSVARVQAELARLQRRVAELEGAAGSTAVALNLTVSATVGSGSLVVWPAGTSKPLATAIQWFAGGQSLSNGFTAAISATRQLAVYCSAGSTHFLIDITGYYE